MEPAQHIEVLRSDGAALASAAATAGLDAPVPTCPEWRVRDLVRHLGGVHRWATGIVSTPRRSPWNVDLEEVVGGWPDDRALIDWFSAGHRSLVDALCTAAPDLECWTFLAAPSPLAMWARRQAHETAIHRVDAELAAGSEPPPIDATFAADGVDELLACFITRPRGRLRSDPTRTLGFHCTETGDSWIVSIGPDAVTTSRPAGGSADCDVSGPAHDLYLALWNRAPADPLDVAGDASVLDLFLDKVHIRWS